MIQLNEQKAQEFLQKNNIANGNISKVAGDASFRSYYRIFAEDKKWILMFAPPSKEDILPFIKIDKLLLEHGFSAPEIFDIDEEKYNYLKAGTFGEGAHEVIKVHFYEYNQFPEVLQKIGDVKAECAFWRFKVLKGEA